ncbi:MAG: hypothetical protein ABEL76_05845 [Bradymonadaceae bacterium]
MTSLFSGVRVERILEGTSRRAAVRMEVGRRTRRRTYLQTLPTPHERVPTRIGDVNEAAAQTGGTGRRDGCQRCGAPSASGGRVRDVVRV